MAKKKVAKKRKKKAKKINITTVSVDIDDKTTFVGVFDFDDKPGRMSIVAEKESKGGIDRVVIDLENCYELAYVISCGLMECTKMTEIKRLKKGENKFSLGTW